MDGKDWMKMASEETLRIVTDLSPEAAITQWLAGLGIDAPIKTEIGDRTVYYADGPGMILAAAETSERARGYMQELFGIAPNLEIAFELDFCRDRSGPRTTIIKGTLALMRATGADGGLWFDGNRKLVLMKHGDDLRILDDENLWTHPRLQLLNDLPYQREALKAY